MLNNEIVSAISAGKEYIGFQVEVSVNKSFTIRVKSLNTGIVPNTGYRPFYTMMGHFVASGRLIHLWGALRPLAQ